MPEWLREKVQRMAYSCPLCELYYEIDSLECPKCPLKICANGSGSPYDIWNSVRSRDDEQANKIRQQAAAKIVEIVEAWEVEDVNRN